MIERDDAPHPSLTASARLGSVRGVLPPLAGVAALLLLTVSVAWLGKHAAPATVAGRPGPSHAVPGAIATAPSPGATASVPSSSGSPANAVALPVWTPPSGALRQLPITGDANSLAADGDALYQEAYRTDGRAQVRRLDLRTGAAALLTTLPAGHDAGALAAADGRVAWVEWWAPGGAFTGGPCAPGQPVVKAWRIWLGDAAHPAGRVVASGTARDGWTVAAGCLDPIPPRIALSADAVAFDVRSGGLTRVEIHALSDGRRLYTYDAGPSALVTDLRLAGNTLAVAVQELGPVATADEVTLVRWRGANWSTETGPGLGVALAPDGSVALVVRPLNSGLSGQRVGMALDRQPLVGVRPVGAQQLAPAAGAPDGSYADAPAIGAWEGAEADLWRGIAPDGTAYPVLQLAGEARVVRGHGSPGWTAISGRWALWTDLTVPTPMLDVLDLSAVPVAPAVTATHPAVTVMPASGLFTGQTVAVRVTGFGVGGKVWLSECASAQDASSLGCGTQLAAQPFLVTDDTRAGVGTFTVSLHAATQPLQPRPSAGCADQCVLVATLGDGLAYAVARIRFSPLADRPLPPCTAAQLATSVVDTGGAAGTLEGWLRFVNTSAVPCRLSGWPTLVGVTASGATTLAHHTDELLGQPPDAVLPPVVLTPGEAAVAAFAGMDIPVGGGTAATCPPPYHTLRVTPPGTAMSVTLPAFDGTELPACAGIEVSSVVAAAAEPELLPWRP